jgi:diguanylate cyclase
VLRPDQTREQNRLAAVTALDVNGPVAQPDLDGVVRTAALACNMPISLVSLVGQDSQWFKAEVGLDGLTGTPRAVSFCAHAIQQDDIFEVTDATKDPRFAQNALVTGAPHIRFYAGAPLRLDDGLNAGTLCVIGDKPGKLTANQREMLAHLANVAVALLRRQRDVQRAAQVAAELQAVNDTIPVGIFLTDADGACLRVNAQWLVIYGMTEAEALGDGWSGRIHPDDRAAVFARWQDCTLHRIDFEMQFRLLHPNGTVKVVQALSRPTFGADGQISGHVGSVQDVTATLVVQQELDQKRDRLSAIMDATGAATFEWNLQTDEARVTESWARLMGQKLADLPTVTLTPEFLSLHPDDRDAAQSVLNDALAGDVTQPFEMKYRKQHADGHWIWLLTRFRVSTTSPDGRPEWISAVQIDISDQKRQEAALRNSQSLLAKTGEVAGVGGWSIDLLTGVLTWTDQTCRIHGIEPPFAPNLEGAIDYYAPESRPLIENAVRQAMEFGTAWDLELELIRVDGARIWVRAVGAVDFEGRIPVRVYGAFQDISARITQEKALIAEKARVILATKSGGIGIWDFNATTRKATWDDQMYRLFGADPALQEDPTIVWNRAMHPDDFLRVEAESTKARSQKTRIETEFRVIWPDGSLHHLHAMANPAQDIENGLIGVNWDVTALRSLTTKLAEQHQLMRVTMRSIGDAVITTDANGVITWMNPVAEALTGWTTQEAASRPMAQVFNILNEATMLPVESPVDTCLIGGTSVGLAAGTILISRTGEQFGIEDSAAPIKDDNGKVLGVVLVFHDVTAERRLSGEMTFRATHDTLTGVKNRTEFELRLSRLLQQSGEDKSVHAMMFIDLDQFKLVNDGCGHSAGDEVLQQVARIFAETIRARDMVARIGGDEFGVILEHCSIEKAATIAQSICDKMESYRYTQGDRRFRIGASIGLVPVDSRWPSVAAMIQTADASCAIAKDSGRNRVQIWQDSAAALKIRQGEVHWASRLELALDEDRFVLFAQPIKPLMDKYHGIHAEMLIRLVDTDGAYILPGVFMPSAERFNLATRIDRWVLKHAVTFMAGLPDLSPIDTFSLNLSGRSIGDRAFHRHAVALLDAAGPAICSRLSLEITETAAVANIADASYFIEQVHALGVRVALDDFGAGAASFGYLRALKVDSLKIDGQFVKGLQTDPISNVTVRCFIELARIMGIPTVAEFVDHPDILAAVVALGVDFAQGFLISKPQPLAEFCATYLPPMDVVA